MHHTHVKHGGGNVKCCTCFSSSGVGNLTFIDDNMTDESDRQILEKKFAEICIEVRHDP